MHMYCQCKFHLQILFRKTIDIVNISFLFGKKQVQLPFLKMNLKSYKIFCVSTFFHFLLIIWPVGNLIYFPTPDTPPNFVFFCTVMYNTEL